ncbi:MAG: SDR family NAD(P)-dependent oxidoreductase [Cellulosilyticaceae bacterium]
MYALITGATSGIGEALAVAFAQAGYPLIVVGRREEALRDLAKKVQPYGVKVHCCKVDLCNEQAMKRLVSWIDKERLKIKFLVNNAGIGQFGKFSSYSYDRDQAILETNVMALTQLTKEVLPLMERGGQILQVASTAAYGPGPYMAVYYASKAYVLSFGMALREELKEVGIGVSTLCPGPTNTPFISLAQMKKSPLAEQCAMTPEAVAKVALNGMMRNQGVIIPGATNRICASVMRHAPLALGAKLVSLTQQKE